MTNDVIPVDGVSVVKEHILWVVLSVTAKHYVILLANGISIGFEKENPNLRFLLSFEVIIASKFYSDNLGGVSLQGYGNGMCHF